MKNILFRSICLLAISLFFLPLKGNCQQPVTVSVDVNSASTPFKLNTGGNVAHYGNRISKWGPAVFNVIKEVGINEMRTHDIKSMDWDLIFKNWNADPLDPRSYDFSEADLVMQGMIKQNFVPFLRLGVSFAASKSRRLPGTNPPDAKKWAIIAERIVAHYVDGWASGFKYPIKYVEIWNEPDLNFYTGSPEKFRDLFRESLIYIKKCHPNLKVGGCGIANFLKNKNYGDMLIAYLADPNGDGNFSDRTPLDFYSWHVYELKKGSDLFVKFADLVKNSLTKHGYTNTESLCTEWNSALQSPYLRTVEAGVDVGATLIAAENLGVTGVYFYPLIETWGMFNIANMGTAQFAKNNVKIKWNSMAWAHKAYADLRKQTPLRLAVTTSNNNILATAAKTANNRSIKMMLCSKQRLFKKLQINIKALPSTNYTITWKTLTANGITTTKTQSVKSGANGAISLPYNLSSPGLIVVELQAG